MWKKKRPLSSSQVPSHYSLPSIKSSNSTKLMNRHSYSPDASNLFHLNSPDYGGKESRRRPRSFFFGQRHSDLRATSRDQSQARSRARRALERGPDREQEHDNGPDDDMEHHLSPQSVEAQSMQNGQNVGLHSGRNFKNPTKVTCAVPAGQTGKSLNTSRPRSFSSFPHLFPHFLNRTTTTTGARETPEQQVNQENHNSQLNHEYSESYENKDENEDDPDEDNCTTDFSDFHDCDDTFSDHYDTRSISDLVITDSASELEILDLPISIKNQPDRVIIQMPSSNYDRTVKSGQEDKDPLKVPSKPPKRSSVTFSTPAAPRITREPSVDGMPLEKSTSRSSISTFKLDNAQTFRKVQTRVGHANHPSIHTTVSSPIVPYQHSYDRYFSTTSLHKLADKGPTKPIPLKRPNSHHENLSNMTSSNRSTASISAASSGSRFHRSPDASGPTSPIESFTPLLLRTGSKVWEDIQESKGQGWLGTRQNSTNVYFNENDDGLESDEEDEYSRVRNELAHRHSIVAGSKAKVESDNQEYNPILYMAQEEIVDDNSEDDGILELGVSKPHFVLGSNDSDNDNEGDDEYLCTKGDSSSAPTSTSEIEAPAIEPSRNKVIAAIDWLLGVGHEPEAAGSLFTNIYSTRPEPTRAEKLKVRDDEQGLNMDAALVLGAISYAI